MTWKVPHNAWSWRESYEASVIQVLRSGHVAQGPRVEELEGLLAARFRPGDACAVVSSGTAALYLLLLSLGVGEEVSVSIPTYACTSLRNAVEMTRGAPRLVDVTPRSLNIDCRDYRTNGDVVVYVDTYGLPSYLNKTIGRQEVVSVVQQKFVEDFTHAPGEPGAGSCGVASVISFGATKPLGVGAGGAVLGPPSLIEAVRDLRDYDQKRSKTGRFNWQLSDVQAALVVNRLGSLDDDRRMRAEVAERYDEALRRNDSKTRRRQMSLDGWTSRSPYRYVIMYQENDPHTALYAQQYLAGWGIEAIVPLRRDELLHRVDGRGEFGAAEHAAGCTVSVPIWPGMSEGQVCRVVDALGGYYV